MADYLSVVYSEKVRPRTPYPGQLAAYLCGLFQLRPGMKLLEPGCGRCEFLSEFQTLGLDCYGLDLLPAAVAFAPEIPISVCDVDREPIPFPDDTFDVIYHKSLLEHLREPDYFLREVRRVLKPGGLVLNLVPDWEANYRTYFDDFTHRTPFTTVSLYDILQMCDFERIDVRRFRQLPVVWKYPALNYFCAALSPFIPPRTKHKFLRWSRELMLLGAARKPEA